MPKFNNHKLEEEIVEYMEKTEIPVSVEFIAQHFDLAWGTARAILLDLALRGRVKVQKTTKSLIFWVAQC